MSGWCPQHMEEPSCPGRCLFPKKVLGHPQTTPAGVHPVPCAVCREGSGECGWGRKPLKKLRDGGRSEDTWGQATEQPLHGGGAHRSVCPCSGPTVPGTAPRRSGSGTRRPRPGPTDKCQASLVTRTGPSLLSPLREPPDWLDGAPLPRPVCPDLGQTPHLPPQTDGRARLWHGLRGRLRCFHRQASSDANRPGDGRGSKRKTGRSFHAPVPPTRAP